MYVSNYLLDLASILIFGYVRFHSISVAGLIPGYWVSFLFIDSWGRKPIQLMGFVMLTVIFIIMGFGYDAILNHNKGYSHLILFV